MSVYVTTYIWEHSAQAGNALLLMLALGDIADKDGKAYPSVKTLARFTRLNKRTIQRTIRKLVAAGELRLEPRGSHLGTHLFEVVMNRTLPLFQDPKAGGMTDCHPVTNSEGGVTKHPQKGDTAMSPEPVTIIRTTSILPSAARRANQTQARQAAAEAITYLNEKAGTRYQHTEANIKFATDRILRDGATIEDLKAVVDLKVADRDFDRKWLRPETLWNATKFGSYLGQIGMKPPAQAAAGTVVVVMGEHEDGTRTVLYTSSGEGEPDPERCARHAIDAGYVRTRFHNQPCRRIHVDWAGRHSVFAVDELATGVMGRRA